MRPLPCLLLLLALPLPASAQPDTLRLADLRARAAAADPRAVQPELLARASALRLEALRTERLPQLALSGQATVQNAVPSVPIDLPGQAIPSAPREQLRAQIEADWALYDGGRTARRADLERARLAEATAGVAAALYPLREAVTEAYFGTLLLQARAQTLALAAEDLEARLRLVRARVADGAALAAEADAVEAEGIRVRQQIAEAEADRRAALALLADLTGRPIAPDAAFVLPDLDPVDPDPSLDAAGRPEFARFARTQLRAAAEARLATTSTRPAVSLFGQAGVGRPSPFDFLSDEAEAFALVGVRVRWGWDWGRARREAEAALVQADVAEAEAEAFARALRREVEDERATIERLEAAADEDARVVALREDVLRVARRRLDEGVLLAADYVDALTDLAEARLVRERHRLERVRAQARLLSTLGLFPESEPLDLALDR